MGCAASFTAAHNDATTNFNHETKHPHNQRRTDDDKKEGDKSTDQTPTKNESTGREETQTREETNTQEEGNTQKEIHPNKTRYDDAGYYAMTDNEKGEQLFDGTERTQQDTQWEKEVEKQEETGQNPVPETNMYGSTEADGGYTATSTGLKTLFLDFRTRREQEDEQETHPSVDKGQHWEDRDFGLDKAIMDSNLTNILSWKRPSELSSSPRLFSEGTTRYDIGQGGAGTCWFLSIVANISEHPEQLKQVIPDDAYLVGTDDYDGVFHCRFWRFGMWEDVYIDDYLPVIYDTKIWGARSATDDNEFWVPLLEKAFARYHGSYQAVYGGQPGDAYLALTGGVAERIDFKDNEQKSAKLYQRIHNAINSGALITCTVPDMYDNVCGLVGGHAYSLTGTGTVNGVELLRVRNPWGNTEWKGAWSDQSTEWKSVSEGDFESVVKDDGEFWISLNDFMTFFDQTTICALTPDFDMDGCSDSLNYVTNIYGEWRGETAAGFREKLRNPRFTFTVPGPESEVALVVQLIQRRENRQIDNFQIRCDLYKVLSDDGRTAALELLGENTNRYSPETQCSFRHKVTPGTYTVVPSTTEGGMEKSFLIRIFSAIPLHNIRELSRGHSLMSCQAEPSFSYNGQEYELSCYKVMTGEWKEGVNAGGQVGHRDSHASNPQYVITVSEPTLVVIELMQEQSEPCMPLGLRLFPTGEAPMDINLIYDLYNSAVIATDGNQSKFVQGWDVKTAYMLDPGQYTLLLHLDKPDTEKRYTILFKSSRPVDVRGYQTFP